MQARIDTFISYGRLRRFDASIEISKIIYHTGRWSKKSAQITSRRGDSSIAARICDSDSHIIATSPRFGNTIITQARYAKLLIDYADMTVEAYFTGFYDRYYFSGGHDLLIEVREDFTPQASLPRQGARHQRP